MERDAYRRKLQDKRKDRTKGREEGKQYENRSEQIGRKVKGEENKPAGREKKERAA